jgi:hypothetical protein
MRSQTAAMTPEGTASRRSIANPGQVHKPAQEEGSQMTTNDRAAVSAHDLRTIVSRDGFVLVTTDDGRDPRYAAPRSLAIDVAQAAHACVLYFDDAAASIVAHAYAWDALRPRPGDAFQRPLLAAELDEYGCGYLRDQLGQAEARSVCAFAWLARRPGAAGIAEAVRRCGADLVIVPAESERSWMTRPVLRLTAAYDAWRIGVPLAAVDGAGRITLVEPLGAGSPRGGSGPRPVPQAAPRRAA